MRQDESRSKGKFKGTVDATIRWTGTEVEVEPDPIYLTRRGNVSWDSGEGDWEVVMEGTDPLDEGPRLGGGKGQRKRGRSRDDANHTGQGGDPDSPRGTHKYTARVKVDGEWKERDPELVVGPER